jgi:hypothetical protein
MNSFTNPFTDESDELLNLVTKAVMPDTITKDLCRKSSLGQQLFDDFVSNRINTNNVNLWSPMKKCQLHTWKTTGKRDNILLGEKVVEMKEDRTLFARW